MRVNSLAHRSACLFLVRDPEVMTGQQMLVYHHTDSPGKREVWKSQKSTADLLDVPPQIVQDQIWCLIGSRLGPQDQVKHWEVALNPHHDLGIGITSTRHEYEGKDRGCVHA